MQADGKVDYPKFLFDRGLFGPARLNAEGSPDASFSYVRGIVSGLGCVQFFAQPGGMILGLAGDNDPNRNGNQQVFRLDATGMECFNFKFTMPPYNVLDDTRLAVAPDGRILVAVADSFPPRLVRLAPDGTQDPAFGFTGQPNGQGLYPGPAAFLPDGGAVLVRQPTAGDRRISFFHHSAGGKLLASRDLPNSAVDNGVVGLGTVQARAFAMQPDGKLLFAAAFLLISVTTTREAIPTVKGYMEARAPVVTAATEFGTPTGLDDADSVAVTPEGDTLLAWRSFTFGGYGGETRRLGRYDRTGRQEWLFSDYPAVGRRDSRRPRFCHP